MKKIILLLLTTFIISCNKNEVLREESESLNISKVKQSLKLPYDLMKLAYNSFSNEEKSYFWLEAIEDKVSSPESKFIDLREIDELKKIIKPEIFEYKSKDWYLAKQKLLNWQDKYVNEKNISFFRDVLTFSNLKQNEASLSKLRVEVAAAPICDCNDGQIIIPDCDKGTSCLIPPNSKACEYKNTSGCGGLWMDPCNMLCI